MFTLIGAAIGVFIGIVTSITNAVALSHIPVFCLYIVFLIIMFSYISFGAFAGMMIDILIEKFIK